MPVALAVVAETPPLSPARAALAQAIERHAATLAASEAAAAPANRLRAVVREHAEAVERLAAARDADEAGLGDWLASGSDGERPAPSVATRSAERRLAELEPDAAAASRALPAAEARHVAAIRELTHATAAREAALATAAVEAAREAIADELRPALIRLLEIEARISGLVAELAQRGHGPANSPSALAGSIEIERLIRAAKAEAAVPLDRESARRLLDELLRDPAARLG